MSFDTHELPPDATEAFNAAAAEQSWSALEPYIYTQAIRAE
jgi:hypothetical protein